MAQPEDGSFPWLASLFLRQSSGEAYFMCAATILTTRVLVSAAHCFNDRSLGNILDNSSLKIIIKYFNRENIFCSQYSNILTCVFRYRDTDWFVRVGDNYMASRDPSEQTFQVHMNRPPNLLISPSSSTQSLIQSCHQS